MWLKFYVSLGNEISLTDLDWTKGITTVLKVSTSAILGTGIVWVEIVSPEEVDRLTSVRDTIEAMGNEHPIGLLT
jgi:hypothetical protein